MNSGGHHRLKILFVAMKYDYGVRANGFSAENDNFYEVLVKMGHDILYFDFATLLQQHGRKRMNEALRETVDREKPDVLFCMLYKNEIDKEVMRKITEETETITMNWFSDDMWRFDGFSSRWAKCFDWIVTVDKEVVPKYKKLGAKNVLLTRWACNPFVYHKSDVPLKYDVTFVGQPHGKRREIVQALEDAAIPVQTWGRGWKNGRLSQKEMIDVFAGSRINLNFSRASVATGIRKYLHMQASPQIKGRLVEVPACGGFLLTEPAAGLSKYYTEGEQVAVFRSISELIEKIQYYLSHEDERAAIAKAGYDRTMREHTYVHRFNEIFSRMRFPVRAPEEILEGDVEPGTTTEITIEVKEPLVSVVMPVYNGEPYIRQAIDSVLSQTFTDFELVVANDGSTDNTLKILEEYAAKDPRVRILNLPHHGRIPALNAGSKAAKGEFVASIAADDINTPDRLQREVDFLQEHPHVGMVGSWAELINGKGETTGVIRHPASSSYLAWSMFFRNPFAASSVMLRKSLGDEIGWYKETASEDYDCWSRLSFKADLANIQKPLLKYRIWDGNYTASHKPEQEQTVVDVIRERAKTMFNMDITEDEARALRLPLEGREELSIPQIRLALRVSLRLYHAFTAHRSMSFRERQMIRNNLSEYLLLLAKHAKKQSQAQSIALIVRAFLTNPLFAAVVLERKFAEMYTYDPWHL